jgi:hypothetical protein
MGGWIDLPGSGAPELAPSMSNISWRGLNKSPHRPMEVLPGANQNHIKRGGS